MFKYKTHQAPTKISNIVDTNTFSKVQSGLVPNLRQILYNASNGITCPVRFNAVNDDITALEYTKMTYLDKLKAFDELTSWYDQNREVCERVKRGDFSDFEPKTPPHEGETPPAES